MCLFFTLSLFFNFSCLNASLIQFSFYVNIYYVCSPYFLLFSCLSCTLSLFKFSFYVSVYLVFLSPFLIFSCVSCTTTFKILFLCVLVLDGIELVFFTVRFRFVLKTVLVTQGCVSYCWAALAQRQGLFCSSLCPTSEQAGGAEGVGRGHSQDSWPQLTQGIFQTIWCHAQQ